MIKAKILHDGENRIRGFSLSGHANQAPYGQDIVCAGASILAITVANSLTKQLDGKVEVESDDEKGYLYCAVKGDLTAEEEIRAAAVLELAELGFASLAEKYGSYFKLIRRRWKNVGFKSAIVRFKERCRQFTKRERQ